MSIAENYIIDGTIIITTPQKLALIDAFKAVDMFRKLNIKILGIIENMSYLINPINKKNEYIFGKSNIQNYCTDKDIEFLEHIPLYQKLASEMLINNIGDEHIIRKFKNIIKKII